MSLYKGWYVLALAAVPLVFTALRQQPGTPSLVWWTTHALVKVRPYDAPPKERNTSVQIFAARNEFEPFQLVFRAGSQNLDGLDIGISDLTGPAGALLHRKNISIYFERFLDLRRPSSIEGAIGEWPDPLVPRIDRYAGEKRDALPFKLLDGRTQPVWIEIYVPPLTPPGAYRGSITVSIKEKHEVSIPLRLEVWNFTLPSTSTMPNTFGFNGVRAVREHAGRYTNDRDVNRFTFMYRKAALWHRLSLHGGSMAPPPARISGGKIDMDWKDYDAEAGPFLDGTVFGADEPLHGAKATTIDMPGSRALKSDEHKILFYRAVAEHFRDRGWFDRLFNYLWDEPQSKDYEAMLRQGRLVHFADPEIKNLVTAPFHPAWSGTIDIWSPLVNCFFARPHFRDFCDPMVERSGYKDEMAKGRKLWWYQSCASHGCNIVGGLYFQGWPSYMIDNAAVANRIMPWLAWKYDVRGELYFSMNAAYAGNDAWTDIYLYGGNGDGALVYPGKPRNIGGKTDIPIESIRLKLIREGLEDYEYLVLLSRSAGSAGPARYVASLVTNGYTYERDPAKLYEVRRKIGEELGGIKHAGFDRHQSFR